MAKAIRIDDKNKKYKNEATFLYLFLFTLFILGAISLFKENFSKFFIELIAFLLMFFSIKLVNKGLEFEKLYQKSKIIKVSFFQKYKLFGAILFALSLGIIEFFIHTNNIIHSTIVFFLAISAILLFYGIDPYKNKLPTNLGDYKKFVKTIEDAQKKIDFIKNIATNIQNYQLQQKIKTAAQKAQNILQTIQEDPKDLTVARKFMVVYLDGIKDVITQYNQIDKTLLDESYTNRLIELLDEASNRFEKELEKLKSNDIFDLDVQIDALKQQLKEI